MKNLLFASTLFLAFLMTSCSYKEVTYGGIKDVQLEKASLGEIDLKITARVNNPNTYKITLINGKFNVNSDNYDFGEFELGENTVIPAESEGDVVVHIKTELKNFFSATTMALMKKVQQNNIPVTIKGYVTAKAYFFTKKIKFNKTENVSL